MGSGTSKINKSGGANTTAENGGGGGGRYRCVECKVAPVRLRKRLCEDCIPASDPRELPRRMETFKLSRATSGLARTSTSLSGFFRRGKGTAASATGIADPNLVSMATPALAPEPTNHVEQAARTIHKMASIAEHNALRPTEGPGFVSKSSGIGQKNAFRQAEDAGSDSKLNRAMTARPSHGAPVAQLSNPNNHNKFVQYDRARRLVSSAAAAPSPTAPVKHPFQSTMPTFRKPMGHGCGSRRK